MKRALTTDITGGEGSNLAELLLNQGGEVHDIVRRASTFNTERMDGCYQDPHRHGRRLFLHYHGVLIRKCLGTDLQIKRPL